MGFVLPKDVKIKYIHEIGKSRNILEAFPYCEYHVNILQELSSFAKDDLINICGRYIYVP